jgi:dihydroorotase-like cyclic amidohydrolase
MPNTKPLTISQAALDDKLQRAASKCLVNSGNPFGNSGRCCRFECNQASGCPKNITDDCIFCIYPQRSKPSFCANTSRVGTPQHLLLNTADYDRIGTLAQMNPPLRSVHDNEVLWQALLDGVIDFIATDHAPHTLAEKAQGYCFGAGGL